MIPAPCPPFPSSLLFTSFRPSSSSLNLPPSLSPMFPCFCPFLPSSLHFLYPDLCPSHKSAWHFNHHIQRTYRITKPHPSQLAIRAESLDIGASIVFLHTVVGCLRRSFACFRTFDKSSASEVNIQVAKRTSNWNLFIYSCTEYVCYVA